MLGVTILVIGGCGLACAVIKKINPHRVDLNIEPNKDYSHKLQFQINRTTIPFVYEAFLVSQDIEVYGVYTSFFATSKECAEIFHDMGQKFNKIIDENAEL